MDKGTAMKIGFKEIPYFTVMGSLVYDLPRNRRLSLGCVGTPNEALYLVEKSKVGDNYVDVICLHNYDYDGYLTGTCLYEIVSWFTRYNKVEGEAIGVNTI